MTLLFGVIQSLIISILIYITDTVSELIFVSISICVMQLTIRLILDNGIKVRFIYIVQLAFFFYTFRELWLVKDIFVSDDFILSAKHITLSTLIITSFLMVNTLKPLSSTKLRQEIVFQNKSGKAIIYGLTILYLYMKGTIAIYSVLYGRNVVNNEMVSGLTIYITDALSYLIPAITIIACKQRVIGKFSCFIICILVFSLILMSGTRFVFLFSALMMVQFLVDFKKIKPKAMMIIAITLLSLSMISLSLRGGGDKQIEAEEVVGTTENIVGYFSGVINYYNYNEHTYYPVYSAFSAYFYIPRAIWATKPEMLGKWILRESFPQTLFSDGHSGSVSFVGPFYADFGGLYLFFIIFLAILLCKFERFYFAHVSHYSACGLISACILPTIFFAYRSFNTSIITFIFITFVVYCFYFLGGSLGHKK